MFAGGLNDSREENKTTTVTILVLITNLWFGFEVLTSVNQKHMPALKSMGCNKILAKYINNNRYIQ